jgi:hypothetical protein
MKPQYWMEGTGQLHILNIFHKESIAMKTSDLYFIILLTLGLLRSSQGLHKRQPWIHILKRGTCA